MTSRGATAGLVGKLPAHGDFVRRGGPPAMLAAIDTWLDTELAGSAAAGIPLDDAVDALDGWRFGFATPEGRTIAVAVASADKVGRCFPLVGILTWPAADDADNTDNAGDPAQAETWCAAAAAVLAVAVDGGMDADAAIEALAAVETSGPSAATGRWRAGEGAGGEAAALPTGAAFRALLAGDRA